VTKGAGEMQREECHSRGGRLIIANSLNELMFRDSAPKEARALDVSAAQELWLAEPGDVLVTPRPLASDLVEAVCMRLGIPRRSIIALSPSARAKESLPAALRREGMVRGLKERVTDQSDWKLRACALDRPLLDLADELGVVPEGYERPLPLPVVDEIYAINTKEGFRGIAAALGLRIAPGVACVSPSEVERAVRELLGDHEQVLVKCNRGSGGGGQFVIKRQTHGEVLDQGRLRSFLENKARLGHTFVVEARLDLLMEPTIDAEVTEGGTRRLHIGAMRTADGAFQGMDVPIRGLSDRAIEELEVAASVIGQYLFVIGYRGFFDIDGGLAGDGEVYLFEANVRRTSTSIWYDVITRLRGREFANSAVWRLATTRPGQCRIPNGVGRLLSGMHCDLNGRDDILILSTWTSLEDEWWVRYLVAGGNWADVDRLESSIARTFAASR